MPELRLYAGGGNRRWIMIRRCILLLCVAAFGLAVSGCTKCGPIWDDWLQPPKSCKGDHF
jgi:hypothetical protein